MKILSDIQRVEMYKKEQQLKENAILEQQVAKEKEKQIRQDAIYNAYLEQNRSVINSNKLSNMRRNIKSEFLEAALDTIFDLCFGNSNCNDNEEDIAFNRSIISNFVSDVGSDELLDRFESKTEFLSELAIMIKEAINNATEDLDSNSVDTYVVDPSLKEDLINNINGDENIEDITDSIRYKISRATEDFIQKNVVDKMDIKDIMYATKEKLDNVKSGDDTLDDEIKQEQTMAAKRAIRQINNRPHSIFEQMIINMTEAVLLNDELKNSFVSESGKMDMDKIVKRTTSYYTFLEMINLLKMADITDEYIKEAIEMK